MGLTRYCIGDLVSPYKEECGISSLSATEVSGINASKEFFEPAKQVGADTSKYRVVPSGYFACNLMHVGRDIVLPVALNRTERNKFVSPAYSVFGISSPNVLPSYLAMLFNSPERDRYFWFHTDASVRDGMSWTDFCEREVHLPPIHIQRKYAAIYESMLTNQRSYEQGLDDLSISCALLLDKCKKASRWEPIGIFLREIDLRNRDGICERAHGVNLANQFVESKASSDDLRKYKLVEPGQLACNLLHVGRDGAYPIAINDSDEVRAVSPAYAVFEPDDSVASYYLLAWLSRDEVGRYGWFICDDSIRGSMSVARFLSQKVPVPDRKLMEAAAELSVAFRNRHAINERLKSQLKEIAPVLIRGSIEEASR